MNISFWRDLSIIWLSLFCFIGLAIPLVAFYFMVRGMNALQSRVVPLFRKTQDITRMVRLRTEQGSEQVATPIIHAQRRYTQTSTWLQKLWTNK